MKYSKHRWHTKESLAEIAKQYRTRGEFHDKDTPAYTTARLKGKEFLDSICDHMITVNYSTPQLICKYIMETLLVETCMYNTRQVVKPYELDIYFPRYKLALEYNGINWHKCENSKRRDDAKKELCDIEGITLVTISQTHKTKNYEDDVKEQLVNHLDKINTITESSFAKADIMRVDCSDVLNHILNFKDIDSIKEKIQSCSNVKEFNYKFPSEYTFIRRTKSFYLLDSIRQDYRKYSMEQLKSKCLDIDDYTILQKSHSNLYHVLINRGVLEEFTKHMSRQRFKYKSKSDEELLNMCLKFRNITEIKRFDGSLSGELKRRNILSLVKFN